MSQLINSKYDSIQIHLRSDDPDLDTDDTESSVKFTFQRVISIPPQTKALISVMNWLFLLTSTEAIIAS